jgi:hypothetical protein
MRQGRQLASLWTVGFEYGRYPPSNRRQINCHIRPDRYLGWNGAIEMINPFSSFLLPPFVPRTIFGNRANGSINDATKNLPANFL